MSIFGINFLWLNFTSIKYYYAEKEDRKTENYHRYASEV